MLTLVVSEERFTLSRVQATALADYFWQGRQTGAVTAAFQLAQALERLRDAAIDAGRPVQFAPSDATAVYDALVEIGIVEATGPREAEAGT